MGEYSNKKLAMQWDEFRDSIKAATPVDLQETVEEKKRRIAALEQDHEAWFTYYFPRFAYAEPAPFHQEATRRIMNRDEWYEIRSWSRELAKDTRTMFEILKLVLTGKKQFVLMVSSTYDNAVNLLEPYRVMLDSNPRIINDYGEQERTGRWNAGEFTTRKGVKFMALGAGQSPRGTRNEEIRPDVIIISDIDTDEDVRNTDTITKRWQWIERALIGTRSVSRSLLVIFLGNIIARDCCVVRAQQYADHVDVVNIRDSNGCSTWPQKNSEADIDRVLSKISYAAAQQEYFNNPVQEGGIFKEMQYKTFPELRQYSFLVCYIDLSYKSSSRNDYKAATLVGKWKDEYHVHKACVRQTTTSHFAEGLVEIERYVNGRIPVFWVAEENFLQDIIRKELQANLKQLGSSMIIIPDSRNKSDKISRIEAALEPLNRNNKLFLNADEKNQPDMLLLHQQFLALEYGNKRVHDDGPDAVEGAKFILDQRLGRTTAGIRVGRVPQRLFKL